MIAAKSTPLGRMRTSSVGAHTARLACILLILAWSIASLPLPIVTATAVAAGAGIILARWPWLVWIAIALALSVTSGIRLGPITATEILLALALFLWLADGARTRRLKLHDDPILVPILAFAAVSLFSSIRAANLTEAIAEVVKWVEFAAVVAIVPAVVPRESAQWLAASLVGAGAVQALLGLYQFVFRVGPEWFVLFDRFMRASGTFRQPNPFAGYLGLTLPIAVSLALWSWGRVLHRPIEARLAIFWALFYTGAAAVIAAGLLASWSRGGWLGAAAGLAAVVILRSRALRAPAFMWSLAAAILAAVAALFAPRGLPLSPALWDRLLSLPAGFRIDAALSQTVNDENFSVIERLAHWVAALRMWEQAPWLGVGPGNYAAAYADVRLPLWEDALGHAHNLYLNTLAETGLIGFAAFAVMWLALIGWTWRRHEPKGAPRGLPPLGAVDGWCTALSVGVLGAIAHAAVHNLVDNIFVQGNYLHLALSIALVAVACSAPHSAHCRCPEPFVEREIVA